MREGTIVDGKYQVLALLGQGGMGSVYLATHLELNVDVAIKFISASSLQNQESRQRFSREARLLASIDSPHVVKFMGWGSWQGQNYLVMEALKGKSILELLKESEKFSWQQAFDFAGQACAGLDALHRQKLVHRDLSLANLFLCEPANTVKVIDFGLANFEDPDTSNRLTNTGFVLGSIYYMSPEICSGQKASQPSDIYSLGCLVYEMISGQRPIDCDNPVGLIYKHTSEYPPSFCDVGIEVPPAVERIVFKAIQKEKSARYQSALDFQSDMTLARAGQWEDLSVCASQPFRSGRNGRGKGGVILAAIFVLLVAGCFITVRRTPQSKTSDIEITTSSSLVSFIEKNIQTRKKSPPELEHELDTWVEKHRGTFLDSTWIAVAASYDKIAKYYLSSKSDNIRCIGKALRAMEKVKSNSDSISSSRRFYFYLLIAENPDRNDAKLYLREYRKREPELSRSVARVNLLADEVSFACVASAPKACYEAASQCIEADQTMKSSLDALCRALDCPEVPATQKRELAECFYEKALSLRSLRDSCRRETSISGEQLFGREVKASGVETLVKDNFYKFADDRAIIPDQVATWVVWNLPDEAYFLAKSEPIIYNCNSKLNETLMARAEEAAEGKFRELQLFRSAQLQSASSRSARDDLYGLGLCVPFLFAKARHTLTSDEIELCLNIILGSIDAETRADFSISEHLKKELVRKFLDRHSATLSPTATRNLLRKLLHAKDSNSPRSYVQTILLEHS